jgi:4-diphosphocytidyl-2-C-methyl-D-erythritol kinase
MMQVCKITACAKINIGLWIGSPGSDGYHPIMSLFQSVGLSDTLFVARHQDGEGIRVTGDFDCPGDETTLYKAIKAFQAATGIVESIEAKVDKGIPAMAGMGGGSADAAATLVALDRIFGTGLSRKDLADLGAAVGSDVPFFLTGGAAFVTGRGDIIEPAVPRTDLGILLAYPGFGVSTKWAYSRLDEWRGRSSSSPRPMPAKEIPEKEMPAKEKILAMYGDHPRTWNFRNSFEEILVPVFPVYGTIKTSFHESGAHFVSITGSGSCIYGIYASLGEAQAAKEKVRAALAAELGEKTLSGMALHAIKPLETSLFLG